MSGNTRIDMRLTRHPADTPRARLHRAASLGAQMAREVARMSLAGTAEAASLQRMARRCLRALGRDRSAGARFVVRLCGALDRSLSALAMVSDPGYAGLCDALTKTLVELEAAESTIDDLRAELRDARKMLALERSHNEQLRASLAAEQVRAAAALRDIPRERWEEPTRSRTLTAGERVVIDDPDATRHRLG